MVQEKMFCIEGELLHQLNQTSERKNYFIKIANKQFKYTKTQVALLSPIVFKYFIHQKDPFRIEILSDFQLNDMISCFGQLDSLFHSANELKISESNVKYFSIIKMRLLSFHAVGISCRQSVVSALFC
jgi:hypothetical protein